jgi:hypothetical protein
MRLLAWFGSLALGLFVFGAVSPPTFLAAAQSQQRSASSSLQPPQGQGAPPRDTAPARQSGTGALKGKVIDGVTGDPITRARVRLQGNPAAPRPFVSTDAEGGFVFTGLPPGAYTLMADKATYMPGRYPESGRSLRSRGLPLLLRDRQVIEDVTVRMFHGGVIAGRVVDAYGDPVEAALVQVMWLPRGGRPQMRGGNQANDLGEFRIPRLEPGRYLLQVRPQPGRFMDDSMLPAEPQPQPIPTYYPGVLAMDQAQPITIERGQMVSGLDIRLAEGILTVVTGVVVNSDGQPVAGNGGVTAQFAGADVIGPTDGGSTGIRPDGTFRLQLAPGEYSLEARVTPRTGQFQPMRPENEQVGSVRLSVTSAPLESVSIMIGRPASASGKVVFEGSTPPPPSPGQTGVPYFSPNTRGCRIGQATIAQDWTFKVEGLSGTCGAPGQTSFGRWTLKAVMFRGENMLERTVTFEPGQQLTGVQVVVTDKRTDLEFRVSDETRQLTKEYVAIVFSTDKSRWTQLEQMQPHVRVFVPPPAIVSQLAVRQNAGRGATGGVASGTNSLATGPRREAITGLPPGEYFVVAVDDIDTEEWRDPVVLERLSSSAVRVALTNDAPVEVPLQRIKLSDVVR